MPIRKYGMRSAGTIAWDAEYGSTKYAILYCTTVFALTVERYMTISAQYKITKKRL